MSGALRSLQRRGSSARGGFTLIEILLALALVAILFGAMTFMLGNMALLWLSSKKGNFFPQHVDGVTLFLNEALRRSEAIVPPAPTSAGSNGGQNQPEGRQNQPPPTNTDATTLPVEWARPPGWSDLDDPLLLFRQLETPALFVREGESLPNVNCYLYFKRGEGLSILWYSDLEEDVEETSDLFRTEISRYVTEIAYCYYDAEDEEWEIEEDPMVSPEDRDAFLLPQYLKLTFEYEDEEFVRNIYLPQRSTDAPLF
jgi:prepilin-type N-terminal cleavage/methylation domain-containing protein